MRKLCLLLFLCLIVSSLLAQEAIRFGRQSVYLEENIPQKTRGIKKTSSLELGNPAGDRLNVLVQFTGEVRYDALAKQGVELQDYVGSNAYFARILPGTATSDLAGTGLRSVVAINPSWKIAPELTYDKIPEHAREGEDIAITLHWFKSVPWSWVKEYLTAHKITFGQGSDLLRSVPITLAKEAIVALASQEWVQYINLKDPPSEPANYWGARLHGATLLRMPYTLGGSQLTGEGVKIGVWDANVAPHVDYGNREHCLEFEASLASSGGHGMHVTGTIIGSGLLDIRARGMAPKAEVWNSNFNVSSNGKVVALEMFELWEREKISLTNNSYGISYARVCSAYDQLSYSTYSAEPAIDILCAQVPTLTHVFAAGNEGIACRNREFGSVTQRAKNPIYVGNVNHLERIDATSSRGPSDDGRIYPTVSARGMNVFSTVDEQGYGGQSGTSMASPTVVGHLALLTERYKQLNGGALPANDFLKALIANTARDEGEDGPDYVYGFGILETTAALRAMENKWYKHDVIGVNDGQKLYTIDVPEGVGELRVMIAWNDPVAVKSYEHGEKALINDLDLSVIYNGETTRAYVLDKENPARPATKGINTLDPIEQVAIQKPQKGKYTIVVEQKIKQNAEQPFALTWYYDSMQPEMIAPVAGEIYRPGEYILFNVKNMDGNALAVELSYNGGKTYTNLGIKTPVALIAVPEDAIATNNALLRVTDEASNVLIMQKPFTIMGQPRKLQLVEGDCTAEGWKLTWEKVKDAAKYEILKGDIVAGDYTTIGTATTEEFVIDAKHIDPSQNIFAVRAIHSDGFAGNRSVGVLAKSVLNKNLIVSDLPYKETFIGYPLKNVQLTLGKTLTLRRIETPVSAHYPLGSMMLGIIASKKANDWSKPWEQVDNLATFKICNLDLTKLDKNKKLFFTVYGILTYRANGQPSDSQLRLVIDNKTIKNVDGKESYVADNGDHTFAWDISEFAGKSVALQLQSVHERIDNEFIILNYEIAYENTALDIQIEPIKKVESAAKLGVETLSFNVTNVTSAEVTNIPISIVINGKVVFHKTIDKLAPYSDHFVEFSHDFSTTELDGKKFKIELHADLEKDTNPNDNVVTYEVYNKGDVILMPHSTKTQQLFGFSFPVEEKLNVDIDEPRRFTDVGGALDNYLAKELASICFRPKTKGHQIQVAFEYYDLAEHDSILVYTNATSNDQLGVVTQRIGGRGSKLVVSTNEKGSVVIRFKTNNSKPRSGWVAEVREVKQPNLWGFANPDPIAIEKLSDDKIKLKIKVENKVNVPLYSVPVILTIDGRDLATEIPTLKVSTNEYLLEKEIDVTPPVNLPLSVTLGYDGDPSDNKATTNYLNDPFLLKGTIEKQSLFYISEINTVGAKRPAQCFYTDKLYYRLSTKIQLYKESPNILQCKFTYKEGADIATLFPSKLRVWLDCLDDAKLGDQAPEYYELTLPNIVAPATKPEHGNVLVDFSKFTDIKPGNYRMRIALFNDANWEKFQKGEKAEWGQIFDCTAVIVNGKNPKERDLEVVSLEGIASGNNLSEQEDVKIKVRNNGLVPINNVTLHVKLDRKTFSTQTFSETIEPFGGEKILSFEKKANLKNPGTYRFDIYATKQDPNPVNDTIVARVYHYPPSTENLYSLHFVGDEKEWFQVVDMGKKITTEVTLEGWWKLDKPQSKLLLQSKSFKLFSLYKTNSGPDNGLYLSCGRDGIFKTSKGVLTPGQWQHIAIVVQYFDSFLGSVVEAHCYINGKPVTFNGEGTTRFEFEHLIAARKLDGDMGMFRVWNKARSAAEILSDYKKSVRKTDGMLPAKCILEYAFNEGKSSCVTSKESYPGQIWTPRVDAATNNVWQPLGKLISSVSTEKAVIPSKWKNENELEVTVNGITDWSKVKLQFVTLWDGVTIKEKDKSTEISATTELDFSNADHKLEFVATCADLFGKSFTQNFSVRLIQDKSDACELIKLSLLATDNTGLTSDVVVEQPTQTIVLQPEGEKFVAKNAKITVDDISANATLVYQDKSVTKGEKIMMDLSTPRIITVVAENGRSSNSYVIKLSQTQSITWNAEKITTPYTGTPLKLDAVASSGLPCTYYTSDKSVAVVNTRGELVTVGVGTTEIVATQPGDALYLPADEVRKQVEVSRVPLTIKLKPAEMHQGDILPDWEFEYEGLQFEGQGEVLAREYGVKLANGTYWDETLPALEPGEYDVEPLQYTTPEEILGYTVTRTTGKLKVLPPEEAIAVTISVVDENGAPLEASLECQGVRYKTNAKGLVTLYMNERGTFKAYANKDGYTSTQTEFVVDNKPLNLTLVLNKLVVTITYAAGENGQITGTTVQLLPKGGTTSQVIALPKAGYAFDKWNDNNMEAVRTDRNVQESKTYTAQFTQASYTLNYNLEEGGEVVSGSAQQSVKYGQNGTAINVKAKAGYLFIGWSDGKQDAERMETNVVSNLTFTARFTPLYPLNYSEDFEWNATMPKHWNAAKNENDLQWLYTQRKKLKSSETGYLMGFTDGKQMVGKPVILTSPYFSIADAPAAAKVKVEFTYLQQKKSSGSITAAVEYSLDGTNWTQGKDLSSSTMTTTTHEFEIDADKLSGKKYLQLRWSFVTTNTSSFQKDMAGVDDVKVSYTTAPTTQTVKLEYLAGANGAIEIGGEKKQSVYLTTTSGTEGAEVKAVANVGYEFDKWSDNNSTTATRKDNSATRAIALFKKKDLGQGTIVYKTEANGKIEGNPYQVLGIGSPTTLVLAVPDKGYTFLEWNDHKTSRSRTDIVTTAGPTEYTAKFVKEYTVTYKVEGHGEIKGGEAIQKIREGGNSVAVTAVADAHYHFVEWKEDKMTTATRNETNVRQDLLFTAVFAPDTYTIKVKTEGEGNIEFEGLTAPLTAVPYGTELKLKPVYDAQKWQLISIIANKFDITNSLSYTVSGDVNIEAKFERKILFYTVKLMKEGEGELKIVGQTLESLKKVKEGTTLTVVATPADGYNLKSLMAGQENIKEKKEFVVTANVTVTALFEKNTAIEDSLLEQIVVAPNPFNDFLSIVEFGVSEPISYTLLTSHGTVVRSGILQEGKTEIATEDLAEGIYLLQLTTAHGREKVWRVVKNK